MVGIEFADGFHHFVGGNRRSAAAVGPHAGKEVGSNCDVTGSGDLVGQILNPVGHSENFMNDQNDRPLVFYFRVHNESFDRPAIVLHGDPLAVARRFCQRGLGPILRGDSLRECENQQNQECSLHRFPLDAELQRFASAAIAAHASLPNRTHDIRSYGLVSMAVCW